MLLALNENNIFLGFDVLSIDTIEGTVKTVEATDDIWPIDGEFVKPKLTDSGWIEGATQSEIDEFHNSQGVTGEPDDIHEKLDTIIAMLQAQSESK